MQLQINDEGYITGYARVGGVVGGTNVPDDALDGVDEAHLDCYRWDGQCAVLDGDRLASALAAEAVDELRQRRAVECFPIVDRGTTWYRRLTQEQTEELDAWYTAWLDAPATGQAPDPPDWL